MSLYFETVTEQQLQRKCVTRMTPLGVANSQTLSCVFLGLMYFHVFYISLNMRKSMRYRRSLCALYFSEKLNPPINVSVSLENRSLEIHWKPPPTIGSAKKKCFLYQVKITDHKVISFPGSTISLYNITSIKTRNPSNFTEFNLKQTFKKSHYL